MPQFIIIFVIYPFRLFNAASFGLILSLCFLPLIVDAVPPNRFIEEGEQMVPGETYQYLPAIQPERYMTYDPLGFASEVWRYPVPRAAAKDVHSAVKRAQFLRIG